MSENAPNGGEPTKSGRSAATEQRLSGRVQRKVAAEEAVRRQRLYAIGGGVVAVAVVALLVFFVFVRQTAAPAVDIADAPAEGLNPVGRAMGLADAPVTVVEWGDYT